MPASTPSTALSVSSISSPPKSKLNVDAIKVFFTENIVKKEAFLSVIKLEDSFEAWKGEAKILRVGKGYDLEQILERRIVKGDFFE
jgi:hypothetical protein